MSHVEQIKERLNIVDVVGSYIRLQKMGGNFKAICPFHSEKTPSFFVSPERGTFYCFGCGEKGDIFSFVEKFESIDFLGALKILAERAGVKLTAENKQEKDEKNRLFRALEYSAIYFQNHLLGHENEKVLDYVKSRGITIETVKGWRIGFAPDGWHNLEQFLTGKKFTVKEMEGAGLIKRAEKAGEERYYDRFRSRVMFPIFDTGARVIGFSGRILEISPGVSSSESVAVEPAKYLNSPETELFSKSRVLYGLHQAKFHIREKDCVIMVEGQLDLLLSHQAGFTNTVALSGTALTEAQIEVLKRLSSKIVFAFDSDRAGRKAAERSAKLALQGDLEVLAVLLSEGKDPADIISADPLEWKKILEGAVHIIDFMLAHAVVSKEKTTMAKEIRENVFPFVRSLESEIEKARFLKRIGDLSGVREDAVFKDFKEYEKKEGLEKEYQSQSVEIAAPKKQASWEETIERKIYGLILKYKDEFGGKLAGKFEKIIGPDAYQKIQDRYEDAKDELILEAEVMYNKTPTEEECTELLVNLEEECLKKELDQVNENLVKAEKEKDPEMIKSLLAACAEISKKLSILLKK